MAIFAFLAFAFAFVFHGAGFSPDLWFNWQGLTVLGLLLLAWDAGWPRFEALRKRPAA